MSGTVENMKLAELTTAELSAVELDVVSGGEISLSYKEIEFRYTPQKDDGVLATK